MAVAVYFVAVLVPYDIWLEYSYILYGLCVVVLLAVMVFRAFGRRVPILAHPGPVGFQPSELAKVAAALAGAGYIRTCPTKSSGVKGVFHPRGNRGPSPWFSRSSSPILARPRRSCPWSSRRFI